MGYIDRRRIKDVIDEYAYGDRRGFELSNGELIEMSSCEVREAVIKLKNRKEPDIVYSDTGEPYRPYSEYGTITSFINVDDGWISRERAKHRRFVF